MNECKPKPDAAKCAASGFIHTKEWLKDTLPKFLRDSVPRISYRQANVLFLPECPYGDLSARMIIFDCILNKIIYQPVDENIASDYRYSLTVPVSSTSFSLASGSKSANTSSTSASTIIVSSRPTV